MPRHPPPSSHRVENEIKPDLTPGRAPSSVSSGQYDAGGAENRLNELWGFVPPHRAEAACVHGDRLWGHERCSGMYGGCCSGDPSALVAVRRFRPRVPGSCRRWTPRRRCGCRGASSSRSSASARRSGRRAIASGGRGALRPGTRGRGSRVPRRPGGVGFPQGPAPPLFLSHERDEIPRTRHSCGGDTPGFATRPADT